MSELLGISVPLRRWPSFGRSRCAFRLIVVTEIGIVVTDIGGVVTEIGRDSPPGGPGQRDRPLPDCAYLHAERRKPGVTLELLHLEYLEQHPDGYRYTQVCEVYRRWAVAGGSRCARSTIAAINKERWQVELCFKALKQNLTIKTFVGTRAHALKVQVWTALIAILLLKYRQLRSRFGWSLSTLVALLRMNLFTHRDLWAWLDHRFEGPPTVRLATQGELALA
jgi:hypothetical protein